APNQRLKLPSAEPLTGVAPSKAPCARPGGARSLSAIHPLGGCDGRGGVIDVSEIGSELRIGRRVVVTGMAGAGKSTFAQQLSAKTGLPVIHLDVHFWKPGWVEPSDTEWRDVQSTLLAGEGGIAAGNFHEAVVAALRRGDRA